MSYSYSHGPQYQPPQRTSGLAVVSLIFGMMSPFGICICFLSLPLAFVAIICGHVARSQIARQPHIYNGGGLATIGLLGGYFSLLLSTALLAMVFLVESDENSAPDFASSRSASKRLSEIERKITSDNEGVAHGDTELARQIAEDFAISMKKLDEEFFTQTDAKVKLSGGNYVTFCEITDEHCVLVVHVPEYRRFEAEAKEMLAKLAWSAAQGSVSGRLEEGKDLAVGMKGILLYGAVMVGEVGDEDPRTQTTEQADLYPFLEEADRAISLIKKPRVLEGGEIQPSEDEAFEPVSP